MSKPRLGRRARIALLVVGAVALAVAALLVALIFTSPKPIAPLEPISPRSIPDAWEGTAIEPPLAEETASWTSSGSLALVADGRAFGEETYRIDVTPDGATLSSSGRFWFKVVVATVTIAFRQEWAGTARFEPVGYSLHVDAPLGRGYEVRARLERDGFVSERGGEITTVRIDPERAIVLGMFSTYALIPARFAEREQDGIASFDALLFGGPGGTERSPTEDDAPPLTARKAGESLLQLEDLTLRVDRYELQSPFGDSVLYAKGDEFLALTAGTAERPLLVYRTDYFPNGFPEPAEIPVP